MRSNKIFPTMLLVIGIILVATGVTYAWYSYSGDGEIVNSISTGNMAFHYKEGNRSISLDNVMPMTDEEGRNQTNYFEFEVEGKTVNDYEIPYDITIKRKNGSDPNLDSHIKLYLTRVTGTAPNEIETEIEIYSNKHFYPREAVKFNELVNYENSKINIASGEKALYSDHISKNMDTYKVKYRLRMWIDENTEYIVQENGVDTYPYENSTYTLMVNVYGEASDASGSTTAGMVPGIYGYDGNLIDSYDELVTKTGFDINSAYSYRRDDIGWDHCYDSNNNVVDESYCATSPTYILLSNDYTYYVDAMMLVLPDTITTISDYAFSSAVNDDFALIIKNTNRLNNVGAHSFEGVDYLFYEGSLTDDGNHWGAKYINPTFDGEFIYSDSSKRNLLRYYGINSENYPVIPSSVTRISKGAFNWYLDLESITFAPNSHLQVIDFEAFQNTGITSITIPATVTFIGAEVFWNCNNLMSVVFENPNSWTSEGVVLNATDLADPTLAATYINVSAYHEYMGMAHNEGVTDDKGYWDSVWIRN